MLKKLFIIDTILIPITFILINKWMTYNMEKHTSPSDDMLTKDFHLFGFWTFVLLGLWFFLLVVPFIGMSFLLVDRFIRNRNKNA